MLVMPKDLLVKCRQSMAAYGTEITFTPVKGGTEYARGLADMVEKEDRSVILDQFANSDNPLVRYETIGPEL